MAHTVKVCGDSLLAIISDILDFSKIEAGKLAVEISDFDIRHTVESVIELLSEQAHNKGIELTAIVQTDVSAGLRGDAGRLRQVITNLIGNAIKFTEAGKVFVEVTQETNTDVDTILRFTIKDTGIGLPLGVRPRLFQPFTQADGSTTRKYGGTGLGLAISKQLVELMGGEIGFTSEPGQGSTFWFTARMQQPLSADQSTLPPLSRLVTTAAQSEVDAQIKSTVRILLVEDYVVNQAVAVGQLEKLGYRADVVDDGFAALKALALDRYDVVLMDCQMPKLDGYDASAEIRRREAVSGDRHTPIIAMTANAMMGDREKCIAAGMDDYITKPIQAEDLQRVLKQWASLPMKKAETGLSTSAPETFPAVDKERLLDAVGKEGEIPRAFVELYRNQMSEELNRLNLAIRSGSAGEVTKVAHGCAGMNANCGMLAVVAPLRELERMGRQGNLDEAELMADKVNVGLERIHLVLTTML
jgi:CheY-like chemotaxis protein